MKMQDVLEQVARRRQWIEEFNAEVCYQTLNARFSVAWADARDLFQDGYTPYQAARVYLSRHHKEV